MDTKAYPRERRMSQTHGSVAHAREIIRSLIRDPVTKMLLDQSQLTGPQLETILADSLSSEEDVSKDRRRLYRPSSRSVSRGSYNRTLIQAQNNIIRSIYTVLLLGYLKLFDSPSLQPFIELSDTLRGYMDETASQSTSPNGPRMEEFRLKLHETISALAKRHSFKDSL